MPRLEQSDTKQEMNGDPELFLNSLLNRLNFRSMDEMLSYLMRFSHTLFNGHQERAEDAVQDVIVWVLRHPDTFASEKNRSALRKVLRFIAHNEKRRKFPLAHRASVDDLSNVVDDPEVDPSFQLLHAEQQRLLQLSIEQLPEIFRSVMQLVLDGKRNVEIAKMLRISPTTVASRHCRAKIRLYEYLLRHCAHVFESGAFVANVKHVACRP